MEKKLYVGGLGEDMQREDIEDGFSKFGEIENIWVARKPAGFAFVTYKTGEAAEDAVREMNGAVFKGQTLKVEMSRSDGKRRAPPRRETYGGPRDTAYERPRYEEEHPRRDAYRDDYRRSTDYDDNYKRDYAPSRYEEREYRRDDYPAPRREEPAHRYSDYAAPRRSPVPAQQYQRRSRSYDRRRY